MNDFETIRKVCEKNISISKTVIDDFLIYYAAGQYKLDRPMAEAFSVYKHITSGFQKEWIRRLKAQFLAFLIFKSGGLIRKMLPHVELKKLSPAEMAFLEQHARQPWRFCFSLMIENPATDFFRMEDILTGEEFLLFSPGTSDINKSQTTAVWFNLISYNGTCWQTYGPIAAYKSFEPDDIFFFATELDRKIETEDDIAKNLDKNPLPYMMLLSGANVPITVHKQDQIRQEYAEYPVNEINTSALKKSFISEYSNEVYRLSLKRWSNHPHFAKIYYDESIKSILLSASTDRGFKALVRTLNSFGYRFSEEPDVRVNMSMMITAEMILQKELEVNQYEPLFRAETPPEEMEMMDRMNAFLAMILPGMNAGQEPDIEKYAADAGIDVETARNVYKVVSDKFKQMGRP